MVKQGWIGLFLSLQTALRPAISPTKIAQTKFQSATKNRSKEAKKMFAKDALKFVHVHPMQLQRISTCHFSCAMCLTWSGCGNRQMTKKIPHTRDKSTSLNMQIVSPLPKEM